MFQIKSSLALAAWGAVAILSGAAGAAPLGAAETRAPATPRGQKKLNPDLLNLPTNTWVKIKPNRDPEGRSYSGICWGNGMLFYFGGLHGSYTCNDVELYHVAANTWTQATEPEDWRDAPKWKHLTPEQVNMVVDNRFGGPACGTNHPGVLSPKGRPLACHTYQQHVWFPEEHAFYNILVRLGLWAFDPEKREWREVTRQLPEQRDLSNSVLSYDPRLKTVFAITSSPSDKKGVYVFDREKRLWTFKCKLPPDARSEPHTAYDSTRKVHIVFMQDKCFTLDLAAGTTKLIKSPFEVSKAAGKLDPGGIAYTDLSPAYDPQSKLTVVTTKKKQTTKEPVDLWAYDAEEDDWSEVKLSGTAPKGFSTWGLLVYDPEHKCCLLLNVLSVQGSARWGGQVDGLFAFRLKK